MGRGAEEFADFLAAAGQSVWQILPTGPRAKGNSPYSPSSSFAGNSEYIDPEKLRDLGIIETKDLKNCESAAEAVKLAARSIGGSESGYTRFLENESLWIEDFALYTAIRDFLGRERELWPENIRRREQSALREYSRKLKAETELIKKTQYLFFVEWKAFKEYLKNRGIELMGDLPIYPSSDSAEVWTKPEAFLLNERLEAGMLAGVPPDGFNDLGQLWSSPVYNWKGLKKENYGFWIERLKKNLSLFEILRIDHFRGLESYWAAPRGAENASNGGAWYPGPGRELIEKVNAELGAKMIVAEDLGILTPEVKELLAYSGWPSTRVLQFGLEDGPRSEHFPGNIGFNCALYTGTHDNDTLKGFLDKAGEAGRERYANMLGCGRNELFEGVIEAGMNSEARLFIVPMQDFLKLGSEARMNIPGVADGNWNWRSKLSDLSDKLAEKINELTKSSGR